MRCEAQQQSDWLTTNDKQRFFFASFVAAPIRTGCTISHWNDRKKPADCGWQMILFWSFIQIAAIINQQILRIILIPWSEMAFSESIRSENLLISLSVMCVNVILIYAIFKSWCALYVVECSAFWNSENSMLSSPQVAQLAVRSLYCVFSSFLCTSIQHILDATKHKGTKKTTRTLSTHMQCMCVASPNVSSGFIWYVHLCMKSAFWSERYSGQSDSEHWEKFNEKELKWETYIPNGQQL